MSTKIKDRLLSDENIFLSIYLLESYVENKELLRPEERKKMFELRDVFNEELIESTIKKVRERIDNVIDNEDEFFDLTVYFKPKKYEEGPVFRPLHTATLIDQIAMVAMIQVLVYDIGDNGQLIPSELSRLIPSNFYGNRFSYNNRQLFKPWQEQYQKYSAEANNMLYEYCETMEYKYEVGLDLENFYPSIDPKVIYTFMLKNLPLKLKDEKDRNTLKTILKKLLIFKLYKSVELDESEGTYQKEELKGEELKWYLRSEEDACDEEEMQNKSRFAKGIPQGLPHSCFFANIYMLLVKDQYSKFLEGEALFYVDDSVIFTNAEDGKLDIETFIGIIDNINNGIEETEKTLINEYEDLNRKNKLTSYEYKDKDFGVKVHNPKKDDPKSNKSVFTEINAVKENTGERFLRNISRETSKVSYDIFSAYSDEEVQMLRSRTKAILDIIEKEIRRINPDIDNKKTYHDRLIRYRKFFRYRYTILDYRTNGSIEELKEEIIKVLNKRKDDNEEDLEKIFKEYTDDILTAAINFVFKKGTDEGIDLDDLIHSVENINKVLYGEYSEDSYIIKVNKKYLEKKQENYEIDGYKFLKKAVSKRYRFLLGQSHSNKYNKLEELFKKFQIAGIKSNKNAKDNISNKKEGYKEIYNKLGLDVTFKYSKLIRNNSNELERMILNCIFSYVFEYEIDDKFTLAKRGRHAMQYSETRVLAVLRNKNFNLSEFFHKYKDFVDEEYRQTADYSLFQVLDIFKTFVADPKRIDDLILIHKYCCDTWKNGSKHLHFYTLHNQEHAVSMIRSSIQLTHAISYFKLNRNDYFVLFAACYLHDISMVTLPERNIFYKDDNENANLIYTNFIEELDIKNSTRTKMKLCDTYQEIDEFFENNIRGNHASNGAKEILKHKELEFIDKPVKDIIAEVSAGHCYDVHEIYMSKASGEATHINEKLIKIILRLSDLLDMSRYRISKVILDHNMKNLNSTSRFHWISHLITDGCNLKTVYTSNVEEDNEKKRKESYLKNGNITEKLIVTVDVMMSQTTETYKLEKCHKVSGGKLSLDDNGRINVTMPCDQQSKCENEKCIFICKWFYLKNEYLINELATLKEYLNSIPDYFYKSDMEVKINEVSNIHIPNDAFDYLRDYVERYG